MNQTCPMMKTTCKSTRNKNKNQAPENYQKQIQEEINQNPKHYSLNSEEYVELLGMTMGYNEPLEITKAFNIEATELLEIMNEIYPKLLKQSTKKTHSHVSQIR